MLWKDKKAVSEIIGYVILIAIAVVMSIFVYNWLKTYTPSDKVACPDVSIAIDDVVCEDGILKLAIKNTGRFNLEGYFLKASLKENEELATWNLVNEEVQGFVAMPANTPLKPGEEIIKEINYSQRLCTSIGTGECLTTSKCLGEGIKCSEFSEDDCNKAISYGLKCSVTEEGNCIGEAVCWDIPDETKCGSVYYNLNKYNKGKGICKIGWKNINYYPIYSVEIIPVKKVSEDKKTISTCTDAKIKGSVNCMVYKINT